MTKTQSLKPAPHIKLDAELEAHISTKCEAQALPKREARSLRFNYRGTLHLCYTAIITASIIAHVMRELTLIMEDF